MKKVLMTLGLIAGIFSPLLAQSSNLKHVTIVSFNFGTTNPTYFYCTVSSDTVTEVRMENHYALISGFNSDGKAEFTTPNSIKQLNQKYFIALPDPKKKHGIPNVVIYYNGDSRSNVHCAKGQDDRSVPFGYGLTVAK